MQISEITQLFSLHFPQDAPLHLPLLTIAYPLSSEDVVVWYDLDLFLPSLQTSVFNHLQLALILLQKIVLFHIGELVPVLTLFSKDVTLLS